MAHITFSITQGGCRLELYTLETETTRIIIARPVPPWASDPQDQGVPFTGMSRILLQDDPNPVIIDISEIDESALYNALKGIVDLQIRTGLSAVLVHRHADTLLPKIPEIGHWRVLPSIDEAIAWLRIFPSAYARLDLLTTDIVLFANGTKAATIFCPHCGLQRTVEIFPEDPAYTTTPVNARWFPEEDRGPTLVREPAPRPARTNPKAA